MANPGSFKYECSKCGEMVPYEDVRYLENDEIVCKDCYEWHMGRKRKKTGVLWLSEDDGYPD